MKKIKYLAILITTVVFTSCLDVLDKQPLDVISDAVVWSDPALADSYLNDIYYRADFMYGGPGNNDVDLGMIASMGGESRNYGAWQRPYAASTSIITETGAHSGLEYWKYSAIRDVNYFIEQMGLTVDLDADYVSVRVAEARFLRAYMYFRQTILYGGVPIITVPQSPDAPAEELFVVRNSEKECYDFIISECDAIIDQLITDPDATSELGRATKWTALALKSRAALYAASIAKYGTQQLNGLLGFPSGDVSVYAQKSYDASMDILNNSSHALYQGNGDAVENFQKIFYDESGANTEVIFAERYDFALGMGHSFSNKAMPDGFAKGWGSNWNVFYETVELFEWQDGSPGNSISRDELKYATSGIEYSAEELFHTRDPRFRASVFYPETPWQGSQVLFHSATLVDGVSYNKGNAPDGWPNKAPNRNTVKTGAHVKKRVDEGIVGPLGGEDNADYIVFRLGEIYLNLAEAAFYLGKDGEALDAINIIRTRAEMPAKTEVNEDIIRNERRVELFWEDHSWFDLRRWRIAEETLNDVRFQSLKYTYNYDTKKYRIGYANAEGVSRVFQDRHYYLPLSISRISDNPNLIENPGY
ncbi:MAG: RagB/SusD family nutrient uptake outer membrane protein [Prolixibacteraceae bacterium]|nr:RagB/SusD family nutrient uptake outer membrane protein [Prolixibacteraceae bacterium]MBT6766942.1 RagB/SusD family nutrient uptake outer membrane protein [Prolixibacteraceae bacterium]MBT6998806.1 RagB/SusD family nutrient uptake outer membrane protein [Prolixibacteraceae bacterium]MBT7396684.1 RagB/SusD family nutrient uptake outer membrane protein [Prolixibacteraceae bacterium]